MEKQVQHAVVVGSGKKPSLALTVVVVVAVVAAVVEMLAGMLED